MMDIPVRRWRVIGQESPIYDSINKPFPYVTVKLRQQGSLARYKTVPHPISS